MAASNEREERVKIHVLFFLRAYHAWIQRRGGEGVPEKSQKYRVIKQN